MHIYYGTMFAHPLALCLETFDDTSICIHGMASARWRRSTHTTAIPPSPPPPTAACGLCFRSGFSSNRAHALLVVQVRFRLRLDLNAAPKPRALLILPCEAVAPEGQIAFLELVLDELEAADGLLAVAAGEALGGEGDVGQLVGQLLAALGEVVGQRARLGGLLQHAQQGLDAADLGQLVVGHQLARQLEDPLRDLEKGRK